MGLLDDAIREHLELKRKHGADPTEVARQEREALGSGRVPPAADAVAGDGLSAQAVEHGEGPPAHEPPFTDAIPEPPIRDVDNPAAPSGAVSMSRAPDPEPELTWDEPAPAAREPGPDATSARAAGEEDVLEETPEFLQETPEHERLWFEQRPPKDFDF